MRIPIALLAGSLLWALPSSASAGQHHYVGGHPHAKHGYCFIEAPHVHTYSPGKKHKPLYRSHGDHQHFVGDPVAHGYDGPRHRYHGHHPIADVSYVHAGEADDGEYFCYIDGPHFHAYAPAPSLKFKVAGDAYWYAGSLPAGYAEAKVTFRPMTRFYARVDYPRPVIEVEPPVGYVFASVSAPGVVADVEVDGPDVHMEIPEVAVGAHAGASMGASVSAGVSAGIEVQAPSIEVEIGAPAVVVGGGVVVGHRHRHGHPKYKKPKKRRGYRKAHKKRGKKRGRKSYRRSSHRRDFRH